MTLDGPIPKDDLDNYIHSNNIDPQVNRNPNPNLSQFHVLAERCRQVISFEQRDDHKKSSNSNADTNPSVNPTGKSNRQKFILKHCNIVDPLNPDNNIGISVSEMNLDLIIDVLKRGHLELESILFSPLHCIFPCSDDSSQSDLMGDCDPQSDHNALVQYSYSGNSQGNGIPCNISTQHPSIHFRQQNSSTNESMTQSYSSSVPFEGHSDPFWFLNMFFPRSSGLYLNPNYVRADFLTHPLQSQGHGFENLNHFMNNSHSKDSSDESGMNDCLRGDINRMWLALTKAAFQLSSTVRDESSNEHTLTSSHQSHYSDASNVSLESSLNDQVSLICQETVDVSRDPISDRRADVTMVNTSTSDPESSPNCVTDANLAKNHAKNKKLAKKLRDVLKKSEKNPDVRLSTDEGERVNASDRDHSSTALSQSDSQPIQTSQTSSDRDFETVSHHISLSLTGFPETDSSSNQTLPTSTTTEISNYHSISSSRQIDIGIQVDMYTSIKIPTAVAVSANSQLPSESSITFSRCTSSDETISKLINLFKIIQIFCFYLLCCQCLLLSYYSYFLPKWDRNLLLFILTNFGFVKLTYLSFACPHQLLNTNVGFNVSNITSGTIM
jgi:hypothetical protein